MSGMCLPEIVLRGVRGLGGSFKGSLEGSFKGSFKGSLKGIPVRDLQGLRVPLREPFKGSIRDLYGVWFRV